jgi:hypothetical protein
VDLPEADRLETEKREAERVAEPEGKASTLPGFRG